MENFGKVIVVELNEQGQLAMLLRLSLADPRIRSRSRCGGISLKVQNVLDVIHEELADA